MQSTDLDDRLAAECLLVLGTVPRDDGTTLFLIGPDEPAFWPQFTQSPEYSDGAPDPLDRWSRRVIDAIAAEVGGETFYPFGGPPFQPFYSWALASGAFFSSPIRFLSHGKRGLMASFRGALAVRARCTPGVMVNPCLDCPAPCVKACPVGAFEGGVYDVPSCKSHVATEAGNDCFSEGCLARRACPVSAGRRLPEQAQFHMEAFL